MHEAAPSLIAAPPSLQQIDSNGRDHIVQFYQDDKYLVEAVSAFVGAALVRGDSAVVIATKAHRHSIETLLRARGLDTAKAEKQERYIQVEAAETLSQFMVNGLPDADRFSTVVGARLMRAASTGAGKNSRIVAFGEMVNILWATGQYEAALRLEQLWNQLALTHSFSLLCAYQISAFNSQNHTESFLKICGEHSSVVPSESFAGLSSEGERLRKVTQLQQKALALENEAALVQSEQRFRMLVEAVRDYAIFMLDPEGNISTWNTGAERIKGYKSWEIVGKHFSIFYPEEDLRTRKPWKELEIAARDGRFEDEGWRLRKDGSKFWANVVITALRDDSGQLLGFGKVTRDITERMQALESLRSAYRLVESEVIERRKAEQQLHESEKSLRKLSLHLLRGQDEERRRIGRDLHDSLGQYLVMLKFGLDSLQLSLPVALNGNGPAGGSQLAECVRLSEEAIKEVRTISYLLYPPMLEELGLGSAIPWYLEGFTKRSQIATTLDIPDDFGRMSRDVELALFRVLQESLTNVHRHSESTSAHIRLTRSNDQVVMEIEDQGKGLAPALVKKDGSSLPVEHGVGLRGMRERLLQLGGELELVARTKGAMVRAVVPVEQVPSVPTAKEDAAELSCIVA